MTSSNVSNVDFSHSDFRGTNFKSSTIGDGCNFDDALYDESTDFEGTTISRSTSRHPIFSNFDYRGGKLTRRAEAQNASRPDQVEIHERADLVRRLASYPNELADMALAIAATIQDELIRLEENKPNDPDALIRWEEQYDFLKDVEAQLRNLHRSLIEAANNSGGVIERFEHSASIVSGLRSAFSRWISARQDELIDGGTRLALIGLGTGFLQLCGAPVHESVIVTSALLGGTKVAEMITDTAKKIKDS